MEVFYEGIIEAAQKDPYMLLCYLFFFLNGSFTKICTLRYYSYFSHPQGNEWIDWEVQFEVLDSVVSARYHYLYLERA